MGERTVGEAIPAGSLVTATPASSVLEAARAMTAAGCGSALVLDEAGKVAGIVTERDVMTRAVACDLPPKETPVAKIMTAGPYCARPDMPVAHALLVMKEMGFRHIPVLDTDGRAKGVFSIRDALPAEISSADTLQETCEQICESI